MPEPDFLAKVDGTFKRLSSSPVLTSSLFWGSGCAALIAIHKMRLYKGEWRRAARGSLLAFALVSSFTLYLGGKNIGSRQRKMADNYSGKPALKDPI